MKTFIFNGDVKLVRDAVEHHEVYDNVYYIHDPVTLSREIKTRIDNKQWIEVADTETVTINDMVKELIEFFPTEVNGEGYQFIGVYDEDELLEYYIVPVTHELQMVVE